MPTNKGIRNYGWIQEGADGFVFASQMSDSKPLYRLYNPIDGFHHWTMDTNERTILIGLGFIDEGIACCYVFYKSGSSKKHQRIRMHKFVAGLS